MAKEGIDVAEEYLGCHERSDRTKLMKFMSKYGENVDPAKTAWCSYFMNACERAVGKPSTGRGNARSHLNTGKPVELKNAQEGDKIIFYRGNPSGWQGHIAYFVAWNENGDPICLGGNQGNMVKYSVYPRRRILGIRRT